MGPFKKMFSVSRSFNDHRLNGYKIFDNKGMTLVEIMVSLGLLGAVALATAGVTSSIMASRRVLDINQVALVYQLEQAAILRDLYGWADQNRASSSVFASCFVPKPLDPNAGNQAANDTRTFSCPEATSLAPDLAKDLGGVAATFSFSSMPVYGVLGNQLAGTASAPLFLTYDGRPCTSNCPIMAVGYIGRESSSNSANPGKMLSLVALRQNPAATTTAKSQPFRNRLFPVYVGTKWEFSEENAAKSENHIPQGQCPVGQVGTGIFPNGSADCKGSMKVCGDGQYSAGLDENGVLDCKPFNFKSCPANQYVSAMQPDGTVICNNLPLPPPTPPPPPPPERFSKQVGCTSDGYSRKVCDTGLPPASNIGIVDHKSKTKCVLGQNFGLLSPTQIWVDFGCRAVFNVSN